MLVSSLLWMALMEPQVQRTAQDIKADWSRRGISMRQWALKHGFHPATVHEVLTGQNSGAIGVGHRIAVTLGIKHGVVDAD